ncbi:hypothetical protein HPB51_002319 [Rhipicephalus microplus]|uniref:Uncharacterized protein n=1 Tax=Rhipicephalus microplus TaxID=6941 RepID=A0A9J6DZG7_RHIMP|nr:hypothetical protein HPB51_002319 [Rhipicephalus microplus]
MVPLVSTLRIPHYTFNAWLVVLSGGVLASALVTGPANDKSVRFLVFGDWGGLPFYPYTTRIQRNLAKTMAVVAAAKRIDFVVSLGDNFYFRGVRSVDDRRFKASAVLTTACRLCMQVAFDFLFM